MNAQLKNCVRCGRLFVAGTQIICPNCIRKIEEDFQKVSRYIRQKENRESTLQEVSEATGVSVKQIIEFIRQGRLIVKDYPNLRYPCDRCGAPIAGGLICESCAKEMDKEIREVLGNHAGTGREDRDYHGYYQLAEKLKRRS